MTKRMTKKLAEEIRTAAFSSPNPKKKLAGAATIPPPRDKDELWITRDGRRLLVGDMHEDHARNALRMMLRALRRAREREHLATQLKMLREIAGEDDEWPWGD